MFSQVKLSTKALGSIMLVLALTSGISFWLTQRRIDQQQEEAFRVRLSQITGMASATRTWHGGGRVG